MKLDPFVTTATIINSKWIRDLNIRIAILKLLEENKGEKFFGISLGHGFFGYESNSIGNKSKRQMGLYQLLLSPDGLAIIKKTKMRGYGDEGGLAQCLLWCKLVQPLWKTV